MWTESRGRLPTYLLVGGSGPNVVHACKFFFFFKWVQDMLTWRTTDPGSRFQRPRILGLVSCFQRTKVFLGFGSCFQRPRILGSWLMFSEDQGFFGLWLMFSEDQRFWILAHVFRDLGFLDLRSCFLRTKGFLGFGSSFQRTKGSGSRLMFSKT